MERIYIYIYVLLQNDSAQIQYSRFSLKLLAKSILSFIGDFNARHVVPFAVLVQDLDLLLNPFRFRYCQFDFGVSADQYDTVIPVRNSKSQHQCNTFHYCKAFSAECDYSSKKLWNQQPGIPLLLVGGVAHSLLSVCLTSITLLLKSSCEILAVTLLSCGLLIHEAIVWVNQTQNSHFLIATRGRQVWSGQFTPWVCGIHIKSFRRKLQLAWISCLFFFASSLLPSYLISFVPYQIHHIFIM